MAQRWEVVRAEDGSGEVLFSDGKTHRRTSCGKVEPAVCDCSLIEWIMDNAEIGALILMPDGREYWFPWRPMPRSEWGNVRN